MSYMCSTCKFSVREEPCAADSGTVDTQCNDCRHGEACHAVGAMVITDAEKSQFDSLIHAARSGQLALLSCKRYGERVVTIVTCVDTPKGGVDTCPIGILLVESRDFEGFTLDGKGLKVDL